MCAKVGSSAAIQHEYNVYTAIHNTMKAPTLSTPTDAIHLPGGDRMALILPLYSLTVADATLSMAAGHSAARTTLATNVALCGLASIFALTSGGYAHGDIKPSNLMLDGSGLVSLIDLRTAQRFEEFFTESSNFSLGELSQSSTDYDLVCLGSTLAFIEHALTPKKFPTRDEMLAKLSAGPSSAVTRLAQQCLGPASSRPSLRQMADDLASASRDLTDIVSLRVVWPTMR
jgi:serine/threonine protein kinase